MQRYCFTTTQFVFCARLAVLHWRELLAKELVSKNSGAGDEASTASELACVPAKRHKLDFRAVEVCKSVSYLTEEMLSM